jgi:hypothetical protein
MDDDVVLIPEEEARMVITPEAIQVGELAMLRGDNPTGVRDGWARIAGWG